jgi:hypothetical protein
MATKPKSLPEIVNEIYALLEPIGSDERQRVVSSVMTLLGEVATPKGKGESHDAGDDDADGSGGVPLGKRAKRWFNQSELTAEMLEPIFHHEDGKVQIIASEVPGKGKKRQTKNCYLLEGARCLLEKDEAKFAEADVVALCKDLGCHDSANHAANRKSLGNIVTGTKDSGFTLPAPGLKEAAALIKEMATSA